MRSHRGWAVALVAVLATTLIAIGPSRTVQAGSSSNDNACFTAATATYGVVPVAMSGTDTPDPVVLGSPITLSGVSVEGTFSAALFVAGYRFGLLNVGDNPVTANVTAGINATNATAPANAVQVIATSVTVTIIDPTPANRSSGDESAVPLTVHLPLADTVWTPTGGTVVFTQGAFQVDATVGTLAITLGPCVPTLGLTGCAAGANCTGFTPNPNPTPFESTTVNLPPAPPVAADDSASIDGGQAVTINVLGNDTDANGVADIDVSSVAIVGAPTAGTAVANPAGTVTYTNTDTAATSDSFTYTVADAGGLVSNVATVTVAIEPTVAPVCEGEAVAVVAGQSTSVDLRDNCTDANGDTTFTYTVQTPSAGTLTPTATSGVYTFAAPATAGTETFTFTATDPSGKTSELATVTVNVAAPPPPPTTSTTTTTLPPTTTTLPPTSSSRTYAAQCTNSVIPDETSELLFLAAGTAPSVVTAGTAFSVTEQKWSVTVPASVFQRGINLKVLSAGQTIGGTLMVHIGSAGMVEPSQSFANIAVDVPVQVGADGMALPATIEFTLPDSVWTPAQSGAVSLRYVDSTVVVALTDALKVTFTCAATTGEPYLTLTAIGDLVITTPPPALPPPGTARSTLPRTGSSYGNLLLQIGLGLLLLDLGYLVLSTLRRPRRQL